MICKKKFTSLLILGSLLIMIKVPGIGRQQVDQNRFPAAGSDNSATTAGVPIAVTGTLIDGTGAAPVPDAVVVIKDTFIIAVGPRKGIKIPGNARVISYPGGTMLPGFINTHVHSKYDEKRLELWAREGVTTVRDLASALNVPWFTLRDRLRSNPKCARLVAAGPVFTVPNGFVKEVSLIVTSTEDAKEKVNQLVDAGADVIKIGLNSPLSPALSPELAAIIVKTAHSRGKPVAAHVISANGMRIAVEAGVDDLNHLASFGNKSEELLQQIKESGIYWIPTIEASPPPLRERSIDSFKYFIKIGGAVALGNDSGSLRGVQVGMPIREILFMQEAGMTPMQIIEAATRHAARVCRLEKELGTLQQGKLADLLLVEGNPLEDLNSLTKIRLVIHNGVIIRE